MSEVDPLEFRLKSLESQSFSLQRIMICVFIELAKDPKLAAAIKTGFDNAAALSELMAMQEGDEEDRRTGRNTLATIETFRKMTFPAGDRLVKPGNRKGC
jgi:hypothetical protein